MRRTRARRRRRPSRRPRWTATGPRDRVRLRLHRPRPSRGPGARASVEKLSAGAAPLDLPQPPIAHRSPPTCSASTSRGVGGRRGGLREPQRGELLLRRAHSSTGKPRTTIAAGGIVYRRRARGRCPWSFHGALTSCFEDGTRFDGRGCRHCSVTGEVVFTTGMSGHPGVDDLTQASRASGHHVHDRARRQHGVSEAAMDSEFIHVARRDHALGGRLRRRPQRRAGLAELAESDDGIPVISWRGGARTRPPHSAPRAQ